MNDQSIDGWHSTVLKRCEKWLMLLFVALPVLAAIAGAMIVGLIGVSVAMRYLAYAPFRFTEELVGLLMTGAFFLALPLFTLRGEHVRVLFLVSNLPGHVTRRVGVFAGLLGLAFCLWFFALCLPWLEFAFDRTIKTEFGRLLMYPWMAVLPLSMLLTGVAFLMRGLLAGNRKAR